MLDADGDGAVAETENNVDFESFKVDALALIRDGNFILFICTR